MTTITNRERTELDPFTAEIIRSYLLSIMDEMVATTTRTAYSTCFSEGEDFTCGLFDAQGRMVAQAYGVPIHAGALVDSVKTILESYDTWEEGDVAVFNDPYEGGCHQADVVVARPIFVDGEMIGLAANRGHWTDVGGMSPGGWSGTVTHVIQEALIIPTAKLYRKGELNREIKDFILKNVRLPKQCWGDLQAQLASNVVAERRMRDLAQKYGIEAVVEGMEQTYEYSRRRFVQMLERLRDGEFEGQEIIEDDGHGGGPYHIKVKVVKQGASVSVDFDGTDRQVMGPVNCALAGTKSATFIALMAVVDPEIAMNSGVMSLIDIRAPEGCILNPVYPAPVFSWADSAIKACDAILQALAGLAPERVPAASIGTGNNMTASGIDPETGEEFLMYIFEPGGGGARPDKDGNNVDWPIPANAKNESMEVWETRYPVEFEKYEMICDSGGAGTYRGGVGATRQLKILLPTTITGCADRHTIGPWGLDGGGAGLPNRFSVIRTGRDFDLPTLFGIPSRSKFSLLPLEPGDVLCVSQAGGGGYGNRLDRDPELVRRDLLNGYISARAVRETYGVCFRDTGEVDFERTESLRQTLRQRAEHAATTSKASER